MTKFVRSFARRKKFLEALEVGDSESMAASKAGGTLSQFRSWANSDSNFRQDWDDALETGTDFLEDIATTRAMTKSDPLMIMMLKARRPDKYDRGSKLELSGGINVEGSKAKLLNKIAKLRAEKLLEGKREEKQDEAQQEGGVIRLLPAPGEEFQEREPIKRGSKRRGAGEGAGRRAASA